MTPEKRRKKRIQDLPAVWSKRSRKWRKAVVRNALGDHVFNKFIENKRVEWDLYRMHVSRFEIEKYLPIL